MATRCGSSRNGARPGRRASCRSCCSPKSGHFPASPRGSISGPTIIWSAPATANSCWRGRAPTSAPSACQTSSEEFIVVMPETNLSGAAVVADRLRLAVCEEQFNLPANGELVPVTISIGVAITATGEDTLEGLLKRADEALYAAKNGGRNRVVTA